jgi:hypothetical protein
VKIYPAHFFCGDGVVSQVPDFCLHFFTASRQRIGQCRAARIRGRTFKIISLKEVELAQGNPPKFSAGNYADYPLIILSQSVLQQSHSLTIIPFKSQAGYSGT